MNAIVEKVLVFAMLLCLIPVITEKYSERMTSEHSMLILLVIATSIGFAFLVLFIIQREREKKILAFLGVLVGCLLCWREYKEVAKTNTVIPVKGLFATEVKVKMCPLINEINRGLVNIRKNCDIKMCSTDPDTKSFTLPVGTKIKVDFSYLVDDTFYQVVGYGKSHWVSKKVIDIKKCKDIN